LKIGGDSLIFSEATGSAAVKPLAQSVDIATSDFAGEGHEPRSRTTARRRFTDVTRYPLPEILP
jgi:hypothetical protein